MANEAEIAGTALYHSGSALATKAEGYKSTVLAVGRFGETDFLSTLPQGLKANEPEQFRLLLQGAKVSSAAYVQSNAWARRGQV